MRGALIGAMLLESLADSPESAAAPAGGRAGWPTARRSS